MIKPLYLKISILFSFSLCISCSFLSYFIKNESPQKIPPVRISDKIDAFSVITYFVDNKEFKIEDFNYGKSYVKTEYLNYRSSVRAKAFFSINDSGYLDLDFKDCQYQNSELIGNKVVYNWTNSDLYYDELIPIRNKYISHIDSLLKDSVSLNLCKDHFLSSFKYTYLVLKTLTEVGREKHVAEHYINKKYNWSLPLIDFQFNKSSKYQKKYVALFGCDINESNGLFSNLFRNRIYINVYTDYDSLSGINKQ